MEKIKELLGLPKEAKEADIMTAIADMQSENEALKSKVVIKLDIDAAKKLAKEQVFDKATYASVETAFVAEDGQVFLEEGLCSLHSKNRNIQYFKIKR